MAGTEVYFYKDDDGSVSVLDWLLSLRKTNERAAKKCFSLVKLLREFGHELRRPRADFLRDGIHELRTEVGSVNYRILDGFLRKDVAILASGLTKEKTVSPCEIDRAASRIAKYKQDPDGHRFDYEESRERSDFLAYRNHAGPAGRLRIRLQSSAHVLANQ